MDIKRYQVVKLDGQLPVTKDAMHVILALVTLLYYKQPPPLEHSPAYYIGALCDVVELQKYTAASKGENS